MTFGEKLKELRIRKGWTQKELAHNIGKQRRAIIRYESGECYPRRDDYRKLAEILDVDVNYLLTEDEKFMSGVREQYGHRGQLQAEEVFSQARELFAGGELSEEDKQAFIAELQEIFLEFKKRARDKYTPKRYRKAPGGNESTE